jgi:hypothetical protein
VEINSLNDVGGDIAVYDRSNRFHISDYFEGFLRAQRVNEAAKNTEKLVEAFKKTFMDQKNSLSPEVKARGLNGMYDALRQIRDFDPDNLDGPVTAVFGQQDEKSPVLRALRKNLRNEGIAEEAFEIVPDNVRKPVKRQIRTLEGMTISYDEAYKDLIEQRPSADGRTQIVITTQRIVESDVDVGSRRN